MVGNFSGNTKATPLKAVLPPQFIGPHQYNKWNMVHCNKLQWKTQDCHILQQKMKEKNEKLQKNEK
ncbi:hypothetical protein [Christensenella intestinihominis]|uniref:hypothetical protein n=1 Tax=Christensenella intestinihominis TaxID=1851429 RepID=UPI000831E451|nr:hypothetical protein [Christensenella intestinihominis]